jgi:DNA-directed RNA polymerase subunit M/transcription elongation factor TFIIS
MNQCEYRDKFIKLLKKEKLNLKAIEIKDIEIGIFNWTINYCLKHNIILNWNNDFFKKIYINKAVSILSNLKKNNYIGNDYIIKNIKNKKYLPHEISFLKIQEIYPSKWEFLINDITKKEEAIKNNKNISKTDQFKCGKCKSRECSYYEMQIRSADESATLFITCLKCNSRWRQ